jgi:hypothetical protein
MANGYPVIKRYYRVRTLLRENSKPQFSTGHLYGLSFVSGISDSMNFLHTYSNMAPRMLRPSKPFTAKTTLEIEFSGLQPLTQGM